MLIKSTLAKLIGEPVYSAIQHSRVSCCLRKEIKPVCSVSLKALGRRGIMDNDENELGI
jgi:hypothetical protein